MKRFLTILVLCAASGANAADWNWTPPTKGETVQIAALEALIIADVSTSLDIKNHPRAWEMNPILGQHPSDLRLILTGVTSGLLAAGLWYALPSRCRWVVPLFAGAAEIYIVGTSIGAGFRFRLP